MHFCGKVSFWCVFFTTPNLHKKCSKQDFTKCSEPTTDQCEVAKDYMVTHFSAAFNAKAEENQISVKAALMCFS